MEFIRPLKKHFHQSRFFWKTLFWGAFLLGACLLRGFSQCSPAAPAVAACSGGNGAASNNLTINAGTTYWFTGGPTTFASGVKMNGGTLRVCGTLTLNTITFTSGTIIVESGGTLNIKTSFTMNGSSYIANRGTLNVTGSITMQNVNNTIWNDGSIANITISATLNINSATSKFINKGSATMANLTVSASAVAGAVCVQENSCIATTNFTNSATNSVAYSGTPGGYAGVRVSGTATLNNNVTGSASIYSCQGPAYVHAGAATWGSAIILTNCAGCSFVLPVSLVNFSAVRNQGYVQLQWQTTGELNNKGFTVQRSLDGYRFTDLLQVPAQTGSGTFHTYSALDATAPISACYYRLQQNDIDGNSTYSEVRPIQPLDGNNDIQVYPTLLNGSEPISIHLKAAQADMLRVSLISSQGRQLVNRTYSIPAGPNNFSFQVPSLPTGLYYLNISSNKLQISYSKKIMVGN
jgi:hypothetical protein